MKEKTLGILGGVGPLATVYFADLIVKMTPAKCDQDHIRTIVSNNPKIPDRTDYILDKNKPNPLPVMIEDAKMLESLGCDFIAIPCNTAHFFFDEIQKNINVELINIVEETVRFAVNNIKNLKKLGILATSGTLHSKVYEQVCERFSVDCEIPTDEETASLMRIIYDEVKAGKPFSHEELFSIIDAMRDRGCDAVVLGCTELSAIYYELRPDREDIVDSMTALSAACVKKIKGNCDYEF